MKPAPFEYHRPGSLDVALALLAENEDAKPLAGGQSLVPMLNFRLARPPLSSTWARSRSWPGFVSRTVRWSSGR